LSAFFHGETPVAVHTRVRPGGWARRPGEQHQEPTSSQRAYVAKLIGTCARVGRPLQEWAEAAYVERGVRALRLIQGALHLVRKHPREAVLHAAKKALANHLFRYKDLRRLTEQADSAPAQRSLLDVHETHSAYERVPTGGPAVNPTLLTKLRHLRLSGMAEALPARLAQAEGGSMSFLEFLELLVEDELHRRADRLFARRVKQATISTIKELKDFDWAFNPKIPKTRIVELVSGRFVAQHADALLIGPPGLGKSHIVTAIALGAIRAGYRALVRSAFDLSQDFVEAEALGQRKDFVKRLTTVDALIIEDFGMKKLGPSAAEDLLEVFVRRHENASTVVTTNRPTQDWGVFLGDVPAATAILDRFLSRAQIIQLEGKSYRLHQQRVKQTEEASA
jgi:DNA replication protein DnaC